MTVHEPPRLAERLVEWATPWIDRADVLGDLAEEFGMRADETGPRVARRWYWAQAARAVVGVRRRRGRRMGTLWQDVRFAARSLGRQPAITAGVLATLVLGTSVCLALFGLYDAVAVKPLPVQHARDLVSLVEQRGPDSNRGFSYLDVKDFESRVRTLKDVVAFSQVRATLTDASGSTPVMGELVSGSYFTALGIAMHWGRGLTEADHASGAPVIVISESLLHGRFGEDFTPASILINKQPLAVIGVAAAPFVGLDKGRETQFWAPLTEYRRLGVASEDLLAPAGPNWLRVFGVLAPGASARDASAEIVAVDSQLERTPNRPRIRDLRLLPAAQGDSPALATLVSPLRLLLAGGVLLLLVALANVAGLMVAQAHDRSAELSIRVSLGASQFGLFRLLTSEALLLGVLALLISLPIALGVGRAAVPLLSNTGQPLPLTVSLNPRIVWLGAGLGVLAVLSILTPGVVRLVTFRRSSPGTARTVVAGRGRFRRAMVTAQFAISFGLLVAAVLLARTLFNLRDLRTGFDVDRVALISVDLSQTGLTEARLREYYDTTIRRLSARPDVRAAGVARIIPLAGGGTRTGVAVPGYLPRPGESLELNYNTASGSYFTAMGIPLLQGRLFEPADATAARVAVVNEAMAERYWGGDRAIGRRFRLGDDTEVTVIGVVGDVKYRNLREERRPSFYLSTEQVPPTGATFHVSLEGRPLDAIESLRRAIVQDQTAILVTRARTLRQQSDLSLNDERVATIIGTATGGASALLASIGLFAAFAYNVSRRRREIGLRLALGASAASVRFMILREAVVIVALSSIGGMVIGVLMGRYVQARLYGVEAVDPVTFAVAGSVLVLAAVAASWLPARRASAIDPAMTLRAD